jgi:hypothetical protein
MTTSQRTLHLLFAFGFLSLTAVQSDAALAYGLTSSGLLQFDTASPGTITNTAVFSGLTAGDTIADIDFRPQDGALYGIAQTGTLYTINPLSGLAVVNTSGILGTVQRMDFNPVANRLRVLSSADQNFRITPGTGLVSTDGVFTFAATDINAMANPSLSAAAYTNNFVGGGTTTLFSVDSDLDVLVTHTGAPTFATLNTVGALGVNIGPATGFDIVGSANMAFLSNGQDLYSVNLATGALSGLGAIGGSGVVGLAVVPEPSATVLGMLGLMSAVLRRKRRA